METMVEDLGSNTDYIERKQLEVAYHWIHVIGGLVCMGIILVPDQGDVIIIITVIIIIGGGSIFQRSSRR